ncbi:zinc-binding dehydrogenase [Modestobacter versicolor]|uniref:Alcohol dehydrogenase n=1 Tax=Modestobacter versicolor TaxID=429133 RepID=A0A323V990_9ACTN|nr:zinc-binding dehydrogenase [Modestobacter versicolor]MBB3676812.1 NADPH:quinone reductase-like Zn-dependent oxidoreductase [Modestobacter versicolor]PZA21392.1 alcohol dehydrogenase [Modestobacter versicolor]
MLAWTPTEGADDPIALTEVDAPRPGPSEVVVQVAAYSVNRGETFLLEAPRPGWRPGRDVAGTVVQAASDGSGPPVGRRVVGHPAQGGWAEQVAVPVDAVSELPPDLEPTVAAALPLAGLTALRLLRTMGPLAGRRVLITGAAGGVGHYFVELAAAQGAVVSAVVSTPARGRRLLELGAHELLTSVEDGNGPYDVVAESVGGAVLGQAWSRLAQRGLLVWFGQASREPAQLDFFDWRGGASGTLRKFDASDGDVPDALDLATLVRLVAGGRLHPEVDRVRDWRATPEVLRALLAREVRGNAVLTVPAPSA